MQLPGIIDANVRSLWALHTDLAFGTDDQRRQLTQLIAEQNAFNLGPQWGTKSGDPTRPPSKDAICCLSLGKLWSWDTLNGTSRQPQTSTGQEGEDITGQTFIPVPAINHLAGAQPNPTPNPDPSPNPDPPTPPMTDHFEEDVRASLGRIELSQSQMQGQLNAMQQSINLLLGGQVALSDKMDRPLVGKESGYLGGNITLKAVGMLLLTMFLATPLFAQNFPNQAVAAAEIGHPSGGPTDPATLEMLKETDRPSNTPSPLFIPMAGDATSRELQPPTEGLVIPMTDALSGALAEIQILRSQVDALQKGSDRRGFVLSLLTNQTLWAVVSPIATAFTTYKLAK